MVTSPYLEKKIAEEDGLCNMQVVFVDIVKYSKRKPYRQFEIINAFMQDIENALDHTASQYVRYTQKADVQIRRDIVLLPLGDGGAIGFPFEVRNMHLTFTCELLRIVDKRNKEIVCDKFQQQSWCDCHGGFYLRCGISQGAVILYKDLNGNFNVAGDTVNMASRVMDLANAGQIFLTQMAHKLIVDFIPGMEQQFREYRQAQIKHNERIDVYQYIDASQAGLNVLFRTGLDLAAVAPAPIDQNKPETNSERTADRASKPVALPPLATDVPRDFVKELRARMVRVSAGEFLMGNEQIGRVPVEMPSPFLIDRYPITQEDYEHVMGRNPSKFVGARLPVDSISWLDAITFCNKLSELANLEPAYNVLGKETTINFNAGGYRLPTEAEWEYCCRGNGQDDQYGPIDHVAWYNGNSGGKTHEVGTKAANGFGLHDMLGNVWEWCNDWYQKGYPKGRQVGYVGPASGYERVLRGGSWRDVPNSIKASFRYRKNPLSSDSAHGMRVVLPWRE